MPNAKESLLEVLQEVRGLLALPGNDFGNSTWDTAADALSELDGFIAAIETGRTFDHSRLSFLFLPACDIQEISMDSGWGDEFCTGAAWFDSAFDQYVKTLNAS